MTSPGVFVIVKTDKPYVAHEMSYLGMGPGPYFSLYRPYHLASVEAATTIAEMLVENKASFATTSRMTEVVAMTKKDHANGDKLEFEIMHKVKADNRENALRLQAQLAKQIERIQRDERHGEVTVLQCGPVEPRGSPDWSMAFVGESDAAQAHYASFVKENTAFWRGVTNQALCLLMLELIAIDQKIALKGE